MSLFAVLAIAITFLGAAQGETPKEQAVTIPLDKIWAYEMPGTRDVLELEPDRFGSEVRKLSLEERRKRKKESLTLQIVAHLPIPKLGQPASPGFAVLGSGEESLREANAVLAKGRKPHEAFPIHREISLVFFSLGLEYYVRLDKIEQQAHKITVRYFFVPHRETIVTSHFALIPLGELPAGKWQVDVVRSPLPESPEVAGIPAPDAAMDASVVCRPFSFTVENTDVKAANGSVRANTQH